MDQYFYQWFYQQSELTIQNHSKSTELMLSHNNQSFHTKQSNYQMVFIFSYYSESIHIYSFIWIVWYWHAFILFVCFHISSYSSIQSIQIAIQLILFPESIDKMLSLIHNNSRISNNVIIIMSCFFHCDDIMYTYECFIHSFHYYLFWNIYASFSVIIHIVVLSFQKLLVKRKLVLFNIGHCIELTIYWFVLLLLMLSFVHSLLLLLLIISYLFQTLLLNTY